MALVEVVVNRPLTLLTPSLLTMALLTMALLASACGLPDIPDPVLLPSGDPTRPDIVLLSVDTLRADHLSSYGHSRPTSPFIDSLAAQGQRYTQARSASPWTLPAHTSMMTGQLPTTHLVVDDSLALDPQTRVLPELLSAAGFHTGGFVSTLYVSRVFGFDSGFERFEDFDLHTEKKNLSGQVTMDRVVREALQWWAGLPSGAPVFLFLHTYDAHYAYDPPGAYSRHFDRAPEKGDPKYKNYHHFKKNPLSDEQLEHQRAQYDESIRWIDDQLRWLAESAAISGRQVRFVITSDHGEEFGERGSWGHAHTLYAEQLHIPLIMSGPGLSAQVIDTPVGTQDIAPTLLRWAGVTSGLSADGVDLGPIAAGAPLDRAFPPRPPASRPPAWACARATCASSGTCAAARPSCSISPRTAPSASTSPRSGRPRCRPCSGGSSRPSATPGRPRRRAGSPSRTAWCSWTACRAPAPRSRPATSSWSCPSTPSCASPAAARRSGRFRPPAARAPAPAPACATPG